MTGRDRDVLRLAMTADDQLDDLRRARMWSQLEERLEADVAPTVARTRRGWMIAAAIAAAAAVVALAWPRERAGEAVAFVAPAQATLMAPLGPYTQAVLVGPARAELVGSAGAATTVRLDAGTMLAEFEGGRGHTLHVDAPGLAVDIVGTLFAIEVRPTGSCVSVSHGRVRATIAGEVLEVGGGERRCSDAPSTAAIDPAIEHALGRHEAALHTREAELSSVPSPPSPPVMPALPAPPAVAAPAPAAPVSLPPAVPASPPPTAVPPTAVPAPPPAAVPASPPPIIATRSSAPRTEVVRRPSAPAVSVPREPEPEPEPTAPRPATPYTPPPYTPPPYTPPVTTPTPPPPATAEDRYREAEAALSRGDGAAAERILAALVIDFPQSPLVDQALYERARLAYQRHAWAEARRALDALVARPSSPLAEPGRYLVCRVEVEAHDGDAARCIVDYRTAYPSSPHDVDLLATLVQLEHAAGGCASARAAIAELASRAPHAKLTEAWRARCPEATP